MRRMYIEERERHRERETGKPQRKEFGNRRWVINLQIDSATVDWFAPSTSATIQTRKLPFSPSTVIGFPMKRVSPRFSLPFPLNRRTREPSFPRSETGTAGCEINKTEVARVQWSINVIAAHSERKFFHFEGYTVPGTLVAGNKTNDNSGPEYPLTFPLIRLIPLSWRVDGNEQKVKEVGDDSAEDPSVAFKDMFEGDVAWLWVDN